MIRLHAQYFSIKIGGLIFPHITVCFIFLAFVYVLTVLLNAVVIYVITVDHCLHTPKFLAVVNLAVTDLILNTCIIPSMIKIFLIKNNFVPFNLCLVQMYVYYAFGTLESFALAILAYDRLIAICFPLRQNSINTLRSMSYIVCLTWCLTLGVIGFAVGIMTRLLACNDYTMQWSVASLLTFLNLVGPFAFIFLSYVSILVTVFRMKSIDNRVKALATCAEHLILVAVFYIPVITIFTIGFYLRLIDPDQRVPSLSLASCIPPCINPIEKKRRTYLH
uniref:G-protein coupled receptors family 1 profile domain-containing protein n=1 Tax=Mastacembelus armatus TaxID=205130 RepID=A0A3Q3NBG2_9TELE